MTSRRDRARVAVVVVTHETRDEVLGCLASLASEPVDEVVVVDTGSSDGTADTVRAAHPDVRILELANAGFGRGANAGMRATSAPVVVVANADVRFTRGSIERLAEVLEEDRTLAAVGPAVVYPDGRPQASARRLPDLGTAVGHAVLGRVAPGNRWTERYRALDQASDRSRDAEWLSGCALALRREAIEPLGGFDPGYHLYVEDVDLAVRLRAEGWRLRYEPGARVEHRVGASIARRRGPALVSHARGLARYVRRHHDGPLRRVLWPPFVVGLAAWVAVTWLWERSLGRRHSTTGERGEVAPWAP